MWTVKWQLAAGVLAASVALSALSAWQVQQWRWGKKYSDLQGEEKDKRLRGWETAHKVNTQVTEAFNDELVLIANRPPPRAVLVCPPAGGLPGAPGGAAGTEAGESPGPAGTPAQRDIGAFLAGEADRADRTAAQLNALIDWHRKVKEGRK